MRWAGLLLLLLVACSTGGGPPAAPQLSAPAATSLPVFDAAPPPSDDAGPCVEPAYPAGPYGTILGATLANLTWPAGMLASGAAGAVAIGDALAGCPNDPPILVLRLDAVWCGTCRGYAEHSKMLLAADVGASVRLFDVLLYNQDNAPASARDAETWHVLEDVPTEIGVDSSLSAAGLLPSSTQLPVIVVVNARTMAIQASLSNPTEDALEQAVRVALAAMGGDAGADAAAPAPILTDGLFSRDQWNLITQMALTDPPPPDPSNAFADSAAAAVLGGQLFSDPALSPTGVTCASCHQAAAQLADNAITPVDGGPRNTPSIVLAGYLPWAFYDGRADSLWSQALVSIEADGGLGSDRLSVAQLITNNPDYANDYGHLFGPLPSLGDAGQEDDAGEQAITQVFVNVGKSLEAYERTFRGNSIAIDAYASGQLSALMDCEKDGLLNFLQAGCAQCHYGPRLTDDSFHVLRFPSSALEPQGDPGRQAGIPPYLRGEFNLGSSWSDDAALARPAPVAGAWTLGAFKTPQLRNVALTPPYGHGGNYAALPDGGVYEALRDVVDLIHSGGVDAGSPAAVGTTEPWVANFPLTYDGPIATFLGTLNMTVADGGL